MPGPNGLGTNVNSSV